MSRSTELQASLQKAIAEGDFENFEILFKKFQEANHNKIPIEKYLNILILEGKEGGLLSLNKTVNEEDFRKNTPKAQIVTKILRELKAANLGNLFQFVQAASDFNKESIPTIHQLLKKTFESLRSHEDKKELASALLIYFLNRWKADPAPQDEVGKNIAKEKEKLLMSLLKEGAVIYSNPVQFYEEQGSLYRLTDYIKYLINQDMGHVIKHQAIKDIISLLFKNVNYEYIKVMLDLCWNGLHSDAFDTLIVETQYDTIIKWPLDFFINYINSAVSPFDFAALQTDPVRHAEFEKKMRLCGILLKYNLVQDFGIDKISSLKVQQAVLGFNDPTTHQPYSLLKFIQDVPALKANWMKAQEFIQLKENYQMAKVTSFPGADYRTKTELEEAKRFPESKVIHGAHLYNLVEMQEFIQKHPTVSKGIFKALGPSLKEEKRESQTSNLLSLAKKEKQKEICAAAKNREWTLVEKLIDLGVDVNFPDNSGETALHYAALAGEFAICQKLIERGADVYAKDNNGQMPLRYVVAKCDLNIIEKLLEVGPDAINSQDANSLTPINFLAMCSHNISFPKVTAILIEAGADLTIKDYVGQKPVEYELDKEIGALLSKVEENSRAEIPKLTKNWFIDNDYPKLLKMRNRYEDCRNKLNTLELKLKKLNQEITEISQSGDTDSNKSNALKSSELQLDQVLTEMKEVALEVAQIRKLYSSSEVQNPTRRIILINSCVRAVNEQRLSLTSNAKEMRKSIEQAQSLLSSKSSPEPR